MKTQTIIFLGLALIFQITNANQKNVELALSTNCDKAMKKAESGRVGDAEKATEVCLDQSMKICGKLANGTGDGRYLAAFCRAKAAQAAYQSSSKEVR